MSQPLLILGAIGTKRHFKRASKPSLVRGKLVYNRAFNRRRFCIRIPVRCRLDNPKKIGKDLENANNKSGEAVKWLRETAATGFPNYPLFDRDRYLDRIRSAPEFVQFMADEKARWEEYRREFGD